MFQDGLEVLPKQHPADALRVGVMWLAYALAFGVGIVASLLLPLPAGGLTPVTLIGLIGCLTVLNAFDTRLPQGDYVHLGLPVAAASMIALHPLPVMAAFALSMSATFLTRLRTFEPHSFAQHVLSPLAALCVGALALLALTIRGPLPSTVAGATVVSAVVVVVGLGFTSLCLSVRSGQSLFNTAWGSVKLQQLFLLAQVSVGVLASLLYGPMGLWSLLLSLLVLLVMRQSFSLLLEVKLAYQSTIEALAKAMEAQLDEQSGHGQRVASLAVSAARELNLNPSLVERVGYASLLHDFSVLEAGSSTPGNVGTIGNSQVQTLLGGVAFLQPALPILMAFECPTRITEILDERSSVVALLIAYASLLDEADFDGERDAQIVEAVRARLPIMSARALGAVERARQRLSFGEI